MRTSSRSFGQIVKKGRKDAGFSQRELASLIRKQDGTAISAVYLNDIEHNRRSPSSDHLIEQFAKVLSIRRELLYHAARRLPPSCVKVKGDNEIIFAYQLFEAALRGESRKVLDLTAGKR
jgi:transcriptional regulator with XRE-family HTH domain